MFLASLVAAIALARGSGAVSVAISVFPTPGSRTASPDTQITFRGIAADRLGIISVTGSRTGARSGTVRSDSDGQGGSFVPTDKFESGEIVSVRTSLNILGGRRGTFSFTIATPHAWGPSAPVPSAKRAQGDVLRLRSRPDLTPPAIRILERRSGMAPGDIFVAPEGGPVQDGPMIVDPAGGLVWFTPIPQGEWATDFRVQSLGGRPVLTWWQGHRVGTGNGLGEDVIDDKSYQQISIVQAGNGLQADLHEFQLTRQGTALITAYLPVVWGASSIGGSGQQIVLDSVVQEIDIKTGLVLFQWDSLDHVPLRDSYARPVRPNEPFDYFHVNSVQQDSDGNLVISARNTSAAYKVDRRTGAVIWTLGGKHSTFKMDSSASFTFQHDVHVHSDDRLVTMFDDGGGLPRTESQSRGLTLRLDFTHRTAELVREFEHKPPQRVNHEGNMQQLPDGDTFIGWGESPYFTEFNSHGQIVFDGRFVDENASYRAYRSPWTGTPTTPPAVVTSNRGNRSIVYASWNGATDVARWQVLEGATLGALGTVATSPRTGFETSIETSRAAYIAVRALDRSGHVLGVSSTERAR